MLVKGREEKRTKFRYENGREGRGTGMEGNN
jgi:hypothetical protein